LNSSVIGKIEKAKRYAQERSRMRFTSFNVDFHGENDDHKVSLTDGVWHCTCDFFAAGHGACAHTMALERVLESMVPVASAPADLARAP
jgi:hypothetical protein